MPDDVGMDATTPPQPPDRVAHFLRTEEVLWLSTFGTDGFPGLVPIWFSWDGASILLASKPHAEKVADMRAEPRVMVALGNAEEDFDVGLVEARAELPDTPVAAFLPESHWAKYASDLAAIGLTREEYLRSGDTHAAARIARSCPRLCPPSTWAARRCTRMAGMSMPMLSLSEASTARTVSG